MMGKKCLLILLTICSIFVLLPQGSKAADYTQGYDFGNIELGSTLTTTVSISNLDSAPVELTGIRFSGDSCKDFSVVAQPASMSIPANGSVNFEIAYAPSLVGECKAILWIYDGSPIPSNEVQLTGVGVEQNSAPAEPASISQLLLEKLQKIIDYTNESSIYRSFRTEEQGTLSEKRLKAFKKMLVVTYHLIENGQFEAAYNKLQEIYKKVDAKPESNNFVSADKAADLAAMIQDLIAGFDFQYNQVKASKKI